MLKYDSYQYAQAQSRVAPGFPRALDLNFGAWDLHHTVTPCYLNNYEDLPIF
jgi:hypothetical protein